ncbi:integrase arm-type DNA-binding domain-containing protein [Campylobacter sp. RM9344]|uniref:Integrase arm-type DNA-binding domain-containing protein n=1 Tax=Campylobacter californiensis TaxID=1032243 RepID=A0AAW3ZXG1_9BACT|nr:MULTISPECIES: integrase arm-type DNA-binding domain-containing protein [unclassified Campylobacter]MBE2985313.1 integrase arm-type DNA-binding domain-containing protein [Campylobacter sp. RM6883]MBE2995846.1 integrase arm-type DNA-binding domain-containing protein [Campylobacter sp. RM6913]MBE3030311.1 integrase arm-type DNA-binding domain-containing protein [Campylobacter sp. RM9344]MBE3608728.1 integrase arm-type DNA-binding domain-containing protein [Campylobacter sp. RM9337]QCD51260.1 s
MPKINAPLTDTAIKALKPKDKIYKKSDGQNLFLIVKPTGKKLFAFEYKSPLTNKIRRIALGNYPELSLAEARNKRFELIRQIKDGNDPLIVKKQTQSTLEQIALKWLEVKSEAITPEYHKRQILLLNKHIVPYLGNRLIHTISAVEIIDVLKIIEKSGRIETIKRIFILFNQIFRYALSYQLITHNVVADINFKYTFKTKKTRNFPTLTSPNDIKGLMLSIDGYQGDIKTKTALKLGVLTAVRPFNIRSAEWSEFDLSNKLWVISSDKMKMKEQFKLPLSRQAADLLREYKKFCGNSRYLFPSLRSGERAMSENTLNAALRRLGYTKDELVAHGFRAMFSSAANEMREVHKMPSDIIEKCLAHKGTDKIRQAYNRAENLNDMRTLMQWWADYLDSLSDN